MAWSFWPESGQSSYPLDKAVPVGCLMCLFFLLHHTPGAEIGKTLFYNSSIFTPEYCRLIEGNGEWVTLEYPFVNKA